MDARHRIADISPEARAAAEALRRVVDGRVSTTPLTRWIYSTDASSYRVVPDVVLVAGSTDDLFAAVLVAAEYDVPVVVRGAGTSLAGQAIGPGIMVDCFKLDRIIDLDPDAAVARVEPGVIQASLNRAARPYGLEFGPDTSTVDQATLGGMIGNNSSGSRSIIYGESKDKLRRVAAVLPEGDAFVFGLARGGDLVSGIRSGPGQSRARARILAEALASIRDRYAAVLDGAYADVRRCTSGYNVRELLRPEPNLSRLLAGSEGTLALFTELEVSLDPLPACRLGAALTFLDVESALRANLPVLATAPSAVELVDVEPLRHVQNLRAYGSMASLVQGPEQAMLIVEYQGDEEEARDGLSRLGAVLPELGAAQVVWLDGPGALADASALRRAVLPLLMGAPGAERPTAFIEDTAVPPDRLISFVGGLQRLMAARGVRASFSGHASAGCLHVRPLLDLKSAAGVEHLESLARDVAALVVEHGGVISGEHGCGRSRSCLLPTVLGPDVYGALVAVKDAFDPRRLLGRGTVVDGRPVTEDLRFGADYRAAGAWAPRLAYQPEGGFEAAIERCFGAGLCKKLVGTMCPPAAVDRDEARSTRARANALQGILSGAIPLNAMTGEEFREALGSCVACKACKTECPAGVDMAALKTEWLAEVHARSGVPMLLRGVANLRLGASVASAAAPVVNALAKTWAGRRVAEQLGVAHERPLPLFARRPLTRRVSSGKAVPSPGRVVLFVDCFVQYQEPELGECLADLLGRAGVELTLVDAGCCGRPAYSAGRVDKARAHARRALATLSTWVAAGADVLVIEPSCLSMMRDDWARLLPHDERVLAVAAASRPALALIADLAESGRLRFRAAGPALLHSHCHEKALGLAEATMRALRAVPGLRLDVLDAGCCGMSGVFGYQAEHHDLSVAIAERVLMPAVRAAAPTATIIATGTSCRTQIRDLSGVEAVHPLEFLAQCVDVDSASARRRQAAVPRGLE